jgi:predicted phage-related endonuclease
MIIHKFEQHSEPWHLIRAGKVTGTRFATMMMGVSTKGYTDLVKELAVEIITGAPEDSGYTNEWMQRGTELEPMAALEYESLFGISVGECGFIEPDDDHEFFGFIGISPDRLLPDEGLLEIKCPKQTTHLGYIDANVLPYEYINQVQGQLYVSGLKYVDFMSYYPKLTPFIIRVYKDPFLHENYTKRLRQLQEDVRLQIERYKLYSAFSDGKI